MTPLGRRIDESTPLVDARLRDGLYPERLLDDPEVGDPFAGGPLGYVPIQDRRAYRLWSVGADGVDAGGGPGDVLVQALEIMPP